MIQNNPFKPVSHLELLLQTPNLREDLVNLHNSQERYKNIVSKEVLFRAYQIRRAEIQQDYNISHYILFEDLYLRANRGF